MTTTKDAVISFRVSAEKKQQIENIAKQWRRTPGSLMEQGMDYVLEDFEMENSVNLQQRVENSRNSKAIPAEEVWGELGI